MAMPFQTFPVFFPPFTPLLFIPLSFGVMFVRLRLSRIFMLFLPPVVMMIGWSSLHRRKPETAEQHHRQGIGPKLVHLC